MSEGERWRDDRERLGFLRESDSEKDTREEGLKETIPFLVALFFYFFSINRIIIFKEKHYEKRFF